MPSFRADVTSYLQFVGLRRSVMVYTDLELVFKPLSADGLLLYNGFTTDGSGDFLSIQLLNGSVEIRYDLGTGPAILRHVSVRFCGFSVQHYALIRRHNSVRVYCYIHYQTTNTRHVKFSYRIVSSVIVGYTGQLL